ncbi:MAG: glycosyltransferase family 2 protein [Prevotella sp.]
MPAISIIVPIYNMECLMRRCVDSLLAQTFKDFELLLVDDGSTDGSPAICDEYVLKDKRVCTFHKPNGGLSDARNYGLARARGTYSIFADPDDWVDPEGLDLLYEKAVETDADVVMSDVWMNDKYRQTYKSLAPEKMDSRSVLKEMICGSIPCYTCNKLIRTALYKRFGLQYPKGIYGCEDQYTLCALMKHEMKVEYVPTAFYHYMFYGYQTLSRFYDENTYRMDLKIRDMFVELFCNTEYEQLAYECKSRAIVSRAFFSGKSQYSSKEFRKIFSPYRCYVQEENVGRLERMLYNLSFSGYFHLARNVFQCLFNGKQLLKRIRNINIFNI